MFTQNTPSCSTAQQMSLVILGKWPPGIGIHTCPPHLPTRRLLDTPCVTTCYVSQCSYGGQEGASGGLYRKGGEAELWGMGLAMSEPEGGRQGSERNPSSLLMVDLSTTPGTPCVHMWKGQMNDQRACWPSHPTHWSQQRTVPRASLWSSACGGGEGDRPPYNSGHHPPFSGCCS